VVLTRHKSKPVQLLPFIIGRGNKRRLVGTKLIKVRESVLVGFVKKM